jgi:hypothetical protein
MARRRDGESLHLPANLVIQACHDWSSRGRPEVRGFPCWTGDLSSGYSKCVEQTWGGWYG